MGEGVAISPVKNREQHRSKPFFPRRPLLRWASAWASAKTGSNVIGFFPNFIVRIREHRRREPRSVVSMKIGWSRGAL